MYEFDYKSSTEYDRINGFYGKMERTDANTVTFHVNKEAILTVAMQCKSLADSISIKGIYYEDEPGDLVENSLCFVIMACKRGESTVCVRPFTKDMDAAMEITATKKGLLAFVSELTDFAESETKTLLFSPEKGSAVDGSLTLVIEKIQ